MAARVAVLLSGCGYLDGSEIQEAVLSLFFLDRAGAKVQCFAPEIPQMHVVDHLRQEPVEGSQRAVRAESARIARGAVRDLAELRVGDFDALVVPGGFGVAKNFSTIASEGAQASVQPEVERVLSEWLEVKKPLAAMCIAPAAVALVLKRLEQSATLTIGDDPEVAAAIESAGCTHQVCRAHEVVVDNQARIVTTPAYMLDVGLKEIGTGIEAAISQLLTWVNEAP